MTYPPPSKDVRKCTAEGALKTQSKKFLRDGERYAARRAVNGNKKGNHLSGFIFVLVATLGALVSAKLFAEDVTPIPFFQVVNQHFSRWDSNADGVLSKDEIVAALSSRKIQGESAAAIVAIAKVVRSDKYNLPPLTKDYLINNSSRKEKPSDEEIDPDGDTAKPRKLKQSPVFQPSYLSSLKRLQTTSRDLFPQNLPSKDAIHQGLGDCTFISTVGAMVYRDPAAVKAMFSQNDKGSITVHFGNGENIKIIITDADIALFTSAEANGLWLTALEKAYRKSLTKTLRPSEVTTKTLHLDGENKPNVYEKFSGPTVEILTGHHTREIKLKGLQAGSRAYSNFRQELIVAQRDRRLIKASGAGRHKCPHIAGGHAFAIVGYDINEDLVRLWNPWGNTITPDGPDSLQNGYTTKGGEFKMPLKDFVTVYSKVHFETQIPSRN